MEWREDGAPARAGDAVAKERLREYLTPFAHGVCLAHAPHHVTEALVPGVLDEAMRTLASVPDAELGVHVASVARRLAKQASAGRLDEQVDSSTALNEARQTLARLRTSTELTRERFLLRVVEGIPGPEIADVLRLPEGELRAELERAAGEAARVFGQGQSFAGDDYLWSLTGAPPALFARLEMQLPVLRFDPTAAPLPVTTADSAGTFQDLKPIGSLGGPMKKLTFDEADDTSVGEVSTEPGVISVSPVRAPVANNPFEPQVRTIAATDLPVEARGTVPWQESQSSKSGKMAPLPPRPVPAPREGEVSSKSNSNKSGRQVQVESSSKSGKMAPLPSRSKPDLDTTEAKVPAIIAATREQPVADPMTAPESMLGRPTMQMPLGSAIAAPETRIQAIPAPLALALDEETAVAVPKATRPPGLTDAPVLKGSTPLFVAGGLMLIALIAYSASLFATEKQVKSGWVLTQVVVAAEDLQFGDVINVDSVALRSVPPEYATQSVVKGDALNAVLGQRVLANVQTGDPLFYSQFASTLKTSRLSERVAKRGRGFTIPISTAGAVGRWVHPGDLVDVVLAITGADRGKVTKEARAVTLLQHVRLLATGQADSTLTEKALDPREQLFTNVTLLLTPEEAEVVALASSMGKLTLTLRTDEDDEVDLERGFTNIQTLLDGKRAMALLKRRSDMVQVIRATPEGGPKQKKRR